MVSQTMMGTPLLMLLLALVLTQASAFSAPFFDTKGRLQRTTSPPPDVEASSAETYYVPIYKGEVLMDASLDSAALLAEAAAAPYLGQDDDIVVSWLGTAAEGPLANPKGGGGGGSALGANYWLLELSHLDKRPDELGEWAPLREAGGVSSDGVAAVLSGPGGQRVTDDVAALLSTARGLALWHRSVKFCAACGGKTKPVRHGRNRQCEDCGARYRPRVDPSIIVLVVNEKRDRYLKKQTEACIRNSRLAWPPAFAPIELSCGHALYSPPPSPQRPACICGSLKLPTRAAYCLCQKQTFSLSLQQ